MVRTRNADKAEKEEGKNEQSVEQATENENTRESPVEKPETSEAPSAEEKTDDAAPKANDRMARFKALQARAVSDSQTTCAGFGLTPLVA
jgi:pre-mRNA-splicing factor SYF2